MIFSQDAFFVEGFNFLPPAKLEKIVRPRLNFVPQLALPPSGTSPNWHFFNFFFVALRIMSPPTAGTSSNEAGGQRILSTYYLLRLEDPFVNM